METKVLISAPTSAVKNYCLFEYISHVRAMECDYLLVDNTPGNANKHLYDILNVTWAHCKPEGKTTYQAITDSQNVIRDYFLKGNYTHLLLIESDLLPPPNIKDRLLAHNKAVVGCPYFIFTGQDTKLMIQEMSQNKGSFGMFSALQLRSSFLAMDGNLQQIHGMGFGCTMIARDILEHVKFRCTPDALTKNEAWSDSFFYDDMMRVGIPVYVDTSITVPHMNQDWVKAVEKPNILN